MALTYFARAERVRFLVFSLFFAWSLCAAADAPPVALPFLLLRQATDVTRVNAGSAAAVMNYMPDTGLTIVGGSQTHSTNAPGVYATHRWGKDFQYQFLVENGMYNVKLLFSEVWAPNCANGKRVFDVVVGDAANAAKRQTVESVDIFARVGCRTPTSLSFSNLMVSSGTLSLRFQARVQNAMISAFEISRVTGAAPPATPCSCSSPKPNPTPSPVAPTAPPNAAPKWLPVAAMGRPTKRHECTFTKFENRFYLIGGRGVKAVQVYDPKTNKWSSRKKTPMEIHHAQAVVWRDRIVIVAAWTGGFPRERNIPNVLYYFPRNDTWVDGPSIPPARRRGAAGVVNYKDRIYVVAGTDGGHGGSAVTTTLFDRFDPATGSWQPMAASAPAARDHTTASVVGDKLVMIGGRDGGADVNFMDQVITQVDIYDFKTGKWRVAKEKLKQGRGAPMVGVLGNLIVVAGGEGFGRVFPKTEIFNVNTEKFVDLGQGNMVRARHGSQVIECKGGLYVAAGSGNQGGGPELDSMEVFTLSGKAPPTCA